VRFYVVCPNDGGKIYVQLLINSHTQLQSYTRVACPLGCGQTYDFPRSAFFAEPIAGGGPGGLVAGGLIGALGGPVGIVLGALFGAALGNGAEQNDKAAAARFNAEATYP
jgi:hypothetical protein